MIGRQALTPIALYKSTGGKRTSEVWEVCHRNPGVQGVISTSLEGHAGVGFGSLNRDGSRL